MSHRERLVRYGEASTALALLSDDRLGRLVDAARPVGSGVGGTSALLEVTGAPVFVKRIPLTDLERRPANYRSTANLFGLPHFCHYRGGGDRQPRLRRMAGTAANTHGDHS